MQHGVSSAIHPTAYIERGAELEAELEAERLQQDMLHASAPREVNETLDESKGRRHTIANLVLYLTQERQQLDTIRMRQVTALVDALFDPQNKNIYAINSCL